ncbi:MAG TPA: M23 family metallopeptidase [Cytophagaceae bacterium]|jgi:murein DD-endopeptidase MepM/ murein hydrolase activator NlpD|nr:M23 family metallopeptidase [Cytophagaceae bacterium]
MNYIYFLFLFLVLGCQSLLAQPPDNKKKNKDFFHIKAPAIQYTAPDTSGILFEEEFADSSNAQNPVYFNPHREPDLINEDTSSEQGELSVVEEQEQLNIDSIWVTIAQYYSIWDSRSINPYKIDGANFKDTIPIALYDSLIGTGWSMPISPSNITSQFGMRHYRWHYGTDLKLDIGDPVVAAFDGIVRIRLYDPGGYGNYLVLRHYNGVETLYGHLSKQEVEVGQLVRAGERIALGGNTGRSSGPHLHFEVRYEGNPIDPEFVYDFPAGTIRSRIFKLTPEHFEYLRTARKVVYHTIRSGENLGSISKKYRVSIGTICNLNRISSRTMLKVGRKLRIR